MVAEVDGVMEQLDLAFFEELRKWIVPMSIIVGAILALRQYKIKLKEEARAADSAQIENDMKLFKLFTELMDVAHARREHHVSERAVEIILQKLEPDKLNESEIKRSIKSCVIALPVGAAAQVAAVAAIGVLGLRHDILQQVAERGLKVLSSIEGDVGDVGDVAGQYLAKLTGRPVSELAQLRRPWWRRWG